MDVPERLRLLPYLPLARILPVHWENTMGLFTSQIPTKKMVTLCRQLATSYDAGLPLTQSMDIVGSQLGDKEVSRVLQSMKTDIRNGATLGEAAAAQHRHLPTFFVQLAAVGETGGRLDIMFRDLAQYYEDKAELRRQIIGSLVYPAIQLAAGWFLGSFALTTIGMIDVAATSFNFGALIERYVQIQIVAGFVVIAAIVGAFVLNMLGVLGYVTGLVGTFAWPFSAATRRFALARFCRSMALLVQSGVSMPRCVEDAASVAANPYIANDLAKCAEPIRRGATVSEAFSQSRYLPDMAKQMIAVGEETGALDTQLMKVSEWFTSEAQARLKTLITIMNVSIILGVALTIGYVIISFYARLYGGLMNEYGI